MKKTVKLQCRKTQSGIYNKVPYHEVYQVTIPKYIIRLLGWQKGDSLEMSVSNIYKKLSIKRRG